MPSPAPSWDGPAPFAMTPDPSSVPCAWPRADEHARDTPVPDARSTTWDAGSAYTALHCGASLLLAGMVASIGSVGDAYDNALAETTIGLDTTECLRPGSPCARGPLASLTDLEEATSALGALLRHSEAPAPPRPTSAGRGGAGVLWPPRGRVRDRSHATRCARNPGWFST